VFVTGLPRRRRQLSDGSFDGGQWRGRQQGPSDRKAAGADSQGAVRPEGANCRESSNKERPMATALQVQIRCAGCNRRLGDLVNEIDAGQVILEISGMVDSKRR